MATLLHKPISRETNKDFGHYGRKIIVTLAPGTDTRDDLIGLRLKGTRQQLIGRLSDIYRVLAQWHGAKLATAKKEARRNGVPWRSAKKQFNIGNRI
jgi:hypothetical protein